MANIDISPYGQNAQMPEGYPIADNLTTDSAQQALSARQGKVLNEKTFSFSMIDLDSIETIKRFIRYDGKWVIYLDYSCKNIAVLPGEAYRITAKSDTSAIYCVLSSSETFPDPTSEPPASFATGFSGYVSVQAGESVEVTIPNDGAWLYICVYTTVDKTPLVEKAFSLSDVVNEIDSLASKLKSEEVFVAANDAKSYEKTKADYQCDGVNDELTIQSAINAIYSAGGGTVRLSSGTFIYSTYFHLIAVDSWQDKQDAISDLATIRSGAALGATSVQSVSVNGETPLTPDANGNVDLAVSTSNGSSSAAFSINITSTTIEIQPITGATMTVGNDVSFQVI